MARYGCVKGWRNSSSSPRHVGSEFRLIRRRSHPANEYKMATLRRSTPSGISRILARFANVPCIKSMRTTCNSPNGLYDAISRPSSSVYEFDVLICFSRAALLRTEIEFSIRRCTSVYGVHMHKEGHEKTASARIPFKVYGESGN